MRNYNNVLGYFNFGGDNLEQIMYSDANKNKKLVHVGLLPLKP